MNLRVPNTPRAAMRDIGPGGALAPSNIMTTLDPRIFSLMRMHCKTWSWGLFEVEDQSLLFVRSRIARAAA